MQAQTWTNGQYRQVGTSYAATHLIHDTMRNQQVWTADNSSLHWSSDTIQPPQSAHFNMYDEAYSDRQTNWQNSAVSFQRPTAGITNNHHLNMIHNKRQNSFAKTQSRNPPLPVATRCQVTTRQDFHQNSARNPSIQSPPNMVKTSTTYLQQDASGHWNQQAAALRKPPKRLKKCSSDYLIKHSILTSLLQDENSESATPVPTNTTRTSLPLRQVSCSRSLESAPAHNNQTAYNHRQHDSQWGFSPFSHPPSYSAAISQSDITTNPASSKQTLHVASLNQTPQQFMGDLHLAKTNEPSVYDARLRQQEIGKNANDLRNSFFPGLHDCPPVRTSSPYGGTQHDSMTQSNQNAQPMTLTASERYNSDASQLLILTLPQPTLSAHLMTRTQQQASVPKVFHVSATGDGGGNGSIDVPDMLSSSLKAHDGSLLSSPGRSGSRAVAVVQPLSQELSRLASRHISSNVISRSADDTTSDQSSNDLEKSFVSVNTASYPENPNQLVSGKPVISCSGASNGVSSDLSQKQLCLDDTVPGLATNVHVDQHVASTPEQSVTSEVLLSQSSDKEKGESPADPKTLVSELSSLPTTQWTAPGLSKLILTCEEITKLKGNTPEFDMAKLLQLFWDGDITNCIATYRTGWLNKFVVHCQKISKHMTHKSVILSQIKHSSKKQLSNYHVLQHNEVYSEVPYKSSWLNVDEQLDYIDKEFGFPLSLKHPPLELDSDSQSDQAGKDRGTPIDSEVLSQIECELAESTEVKQPSAAEAALTQTTSPENPESAGSGDPHYSFEIQVLPPEEARIIFEQTLSSMPQSMDTDGQPESAVIGSVEDELPEHVDAMLSDSEEGAVSPLRQVCCIEKWIAMLESSVCSSGKCQCTDEQSHSNCSDKTLVKEEMPAQKDDEVVGSGCKFNSTDRKNVNSELTTFTQTIDLTETDDDPHSWPDEGLVDINHTRLDRSIVLISEDEDLDSSRNDTPSWMPDVEKDYEEALMIVPESCSDSFESETTTFLISAVRTQSGPEVDCVHNQVKSTGQSCDRHTKSLSSGDSEVTSQMSDIEESCGQAQLTSTNVADPSQKTKQQTQSCTKADLQTTLNLDGKPEPIERKHKSSGDRLFPPPKKAKKCPTDVDSSAVLESPPNCRKVLSDATFTEPSKGKTVKLVLFGSEAPNKHSLTCARRSHSYTPHTVSAMQKPPEALLVSLSPLKRRPSEITQTAEYSVKEMIYENWRKSFPPAKIKQRGKPNKQKCSFASSTGSSPKKAEKAGPPNTGELLFGSEMRLWHQNNRLFLNLKRKGSHSDGHKRDRKDKKERKKKKKRELKEMLRQLADKERSDGQNGSDAAGPLQKDSVLRFSVLPSGFSFNSESSGRKEPKEPVPDKPSVIDRKEKSLMKTVRTRGTWGQNPEKKYHPPLLPPVPPKTSSLFSKFQNKYKDTVRKSTNQ